MGRRDFRQTKIGPRFRRGPSCLGSLVLRELVGGQTAGEPSGRKGASGGWLRGFAYGRSAPVVDATPWGDAESGAAKLFSINRTWTLLAFTRAGLPPLSSP